MDGSFGMDGCFAAWLLDSLSAGVVTVDQAARVVSFNPAAGRILGVADDARAPGGDCRKALARHPELLRLLQETLERESPVSRAELVLESLEAFEPGGGTTIGLTLSPVRDPAGQVRGAALLFRDLAPVERRSEQDRLRDRLAALGQMAAGLAHEIRNPLAAMEVQVGLLRRRVADRPDACELLDELTGGLRAVADALRESLEYVKPVPPARRDVDARSLFEDALQAACSRVAFEGAVERDFEHPLPILRADEEQLRALLVNLLVNALEAMRGCASPRLGLGLRARRGAELEICVSDTGPGIPAELREKVFYPFFSTRQGGSGVGLALAQKIAQSHGGRVEIDPSQVGGCAVCVHLPLHAELPAPVQQPAPAEPEGGCA